MNVCIEEDGVCARDKITVYLLGQSLSFVTGKPWLGKTALQNNTHNKTGLCKVMESTGQITGSL